MRSKKRCYLHGGRSLSGIASPTWKHGMYSKSMPTWLAADYERALKNPHLVSSFEQIAVADVLIIAVMGQLQAEDAPSESHAQAVLNTMQAFEQTQSSGGDAMRQAFQAHRLSVAELGRAQASQQRRHDLSLQLGVLLQQRRKLVDSEVRRRKDAHEMVTADKFLAFVTALVVLIGQVVTDRQQKQQIVDGVRQLMAGPRG